MEGGLDRNRTDNRGAQGHAGPLPPATSSMVTGKKDVEHGPGGVGGEVPDGLYPRDIPSSISECDHMGTTA